MLVCECKMCIELTVAIKAMTCASFKAFTKISATEFRE